MVTENNKKSIGIQAIDSVLIQKYPNIEPLIFAPMINIRGGGEDPLEMISAYACSEPMPHWHFVTYGFSDLYEKTSKIAPVSGFGFELTFRLIRANEEEEPPEWVVAFLQNLAKYVFSTGNKFDNGFFLGLNREINFGSETELNTIAFTYDTELKPINTQNGIVVFLQIVGLTQDEKIAMQCWNSMKFIETISKELPLLITDTTRGSVLQDDSIRNKVERGIETDGSSTETLLINNLSWIEEKKFFGKKSYKILIDEENHFEVYNLIKWRLARGRDFTLIGKNQRVTFSLRDQTSIYISDFEMKVLLNVNAVKELREKFAFKSKEFELESLKGVKINLI
jgi:hypothetical protein